MVIKRSQDSREQLAHKRENQRQAAIKDNQEGEKEPIIDKRLDGPNRPST